MPPIDAFAEIDRVADAVDYALVGPRDSRRQEIHTTRFPYGTVAHLCRDFGDGRCSGCSGALVGGRTVVTAAHCLWSLALGRAPARVGVALGRRDRDRRPFVVLLAAEFYIPAGFRHGPAAARKAFDVGVIRLARLAPAAAGRLPLAALSDRALARHVRDSSVTIAGYPGDRPIGTMWRHNERLERFDRHRLYYSVDTCPGHSGSPVWLERAAGPVMIGVHTSGILDAEGRSYGCRPGTVLAPAGLVNSGVRLTPELIAAIRRPEAATTGRFRMIRVA